MRDAMRSAAFTLAMAIGAMSLSATGDKAVAAEGDQKSSGCRVIVNWDELNMWAYQMKWAQSLQEKPLGPEEVKDLVEEIVDQHGKAKVDRLVHCLFSLPWGTSESGFKTFTRAPSNGWLTVIAKISRPESGGTRRQTLSVSPPLYVGEDLSLPDRSGKQRKLTLWIRARGLASQHGLSISVNETPLGLSESIPELGDKPAVAWLRYDVLDEALFTQGKNLVTATVEKEMGKPVKIDEARLDVRYAE